MSLRRQAVQGVAWSAIQSWGANLIQAAVFLVLARLLSPEVFGLMALALAFAQLMEVFIRQGFAQAVIQKADLAPGHLDTAFWTTVAIGGVLTAVGMLAADLVAWCFDKPQLGPIVRWLSLSFLIGAFGNTQQAILQRRLAFKLLAIRQIMASTAGGVVGISLAVMGYGPWSLVGMVLTTMFTGSVLLWVVSDWRPGLAVSRAHFKELFSFGIYVIGSDALTFLSRRTDTFLIGLTLGTGALGYYDVAQRLMQLLRQVLTQVITTVAFPVFSRLQHDEGQLRHAVYSVTRLSSAFALPAFLGIFAVAPELITVVFGQRWASCAPVLRVLTFAGVLESLLYIAGPVMMAAGKPSWRLAIMTVNMIANVLGFVLVVRWGIVAVAAVFTIRAYLLSPLTFWAVRRVIRIDWLTYAKQFAPALTASLMMVGVVVLVRHVSADRLSLPMMLGLSILVGIVSYVLAVSILAPRLFRDVFDLARLVLARSPDATG